MASTPLGHTGAEGPHPTERHIGTDRRRLRPVAVGAAVAAAVVAWSLVTRLGGVHLRAPDLQGGGSGGDVALGQVVLASGVASLAAWGIVVVLERRVRRVRRVWLGIAAVAFLLSLGGPLSGAGVSGGDRGFLVLLHAVVAVVLTFLLHASTEVEGEGVLR